MKTPRAQANERFEMKSTSYQQLGAVVDVLIADHPDLPPFTSVSVAPEYGRVNLHVDGYRDVLTWARALGNQKCRLYSDSRIQADFSTVVDGVRVGILGSSGCPLADVAHEHETCLEQARAEWAALVEPVNAGAIARVLDAQTAQIVGAL